MDKVETQMSRDAQRSSGSPLAFLAMLGGNAALANTVRSAGEVCSQGLITG
jgi:hypothetical protein